MIEITDINDIILWRKYYFSLPVEPLFRHLLYREVPLIPGERQDYVWQLYHQLDRANDRNSDWAFSKYLTLKFVTFIKSPAYRHAAPKKRLTGGKKQLHTYEYMVYQYANGEVIARVYEPYQIDNLKLFFRYSHHETLGDYLLYETKRGADLRKNYFLRDLADSMHYDNWLFNKCVTGEYKK